eukprot:gnl/MRDRNA2_/MRDRNA2_196046_c0_seq1.p1 gnl/MRDRNA2_/MRDRNA2_196046_c0~~gnl/MRDRNA2_/MRDRNA2_196046_c0_seq1.p1  ORF type:complete len:149 (+),score=23.41 gnl/MRDRNA2_/MRDRNA2_196046_c0_seq1:124-570(+)
MFRQLRVVLPLFLAGIHFSHLSSALVYPDRLESERNQRSLLNVRGGPSHKKTGYGGGASWAPVPFLNPMAFPNAAPTVANFGWGFPTPAPETKVQVDHDYPEDTYQSEDEFLRAVDSGRVGADEFQESEDQKRQRNPQPWGPGLYGFK